MANKAISELPQAQNVNNQDLFVLEQSGIAKKLTAETFITEQGIIDALATALDGHGGIQSVTLASVSGRIRTYRITFSDGSATTFQVYDGTSIDRISRTSSSGLQDTYTIFMSDGTTTFFTVTNGADGTVSEAMLNDALKDKAPAVTETTESSAIANFTDGADDMVMHNIVAEINPVQDLTYGDPYPAGSGVNKLDPSAIFDNASYYTVNGDGSVTVTNTDGRGWASITSVLSLPAGTYTIAKTPTTGTSDIRLSTESFATGHVFTGQATFTLPEAGTVKIKMAYSGVTYPQIYKVQIVSGTTVPAWTPYSNICPISGWTGCNVTRTGKNLFSGDAEYTRADAGYYIKTGTYSPLPLVLPKGTYTISIKSTTSGQGQLEIFGNSTSNRLINASMTMIVGTASYTFTINENCGYIRFYGNFVGTISDIQIEAGSTATAYEEYIEPTTVTVDWTTEAGTVYGGTINVATGLLTVNRAIVDMGTMAWGYESSNAQFYSNSIAGTSINWHNWSNTPPLLCSRYKPISNSQLASSDFCVGYAYNSKQLRVKDSTYTDAATFKTAMSGVQLVYELATPQTYLLTPQQLMTLLGTNNVWADTGNVTVTYPADTKMFIENLTQPSEDDLVANQAITSGKYFMIGNSLYLALANIASGAQITIGTNAQRVSLADALNNINS